MNTETITRAALTTLNDESIANMNKDELKRHLTAAVRIISATPDKGLGRKTEVLDILRQGPASILEIANMLNTSTKNVSSQLSYLRKDGYILHTDHLQRKILVADPAVTS